VEGGGGYYFTNINESSSVASLSKDDDSFGYHAGAGLNWFFTKDYYIGLGGRYIWTKTNDLNIRLDGVLADVNLGFRF
jgi:opacity protein-like surface antigen